MDIIAIQIESPTLYSITTTFVCIDVVLYLNKPHLQYHMICLRWFLSKCMLGSLVLTALPLFIFIFIFLGRQSGQTLGQKKQIVVALTRPTVKCEKTGSCFLFFYFFFNRKCQIWAKNLLKFVFNGLKKHLYMRFDCIPPKFFPFRNLKKNIGKLNFLTVRKKKNRPTDPIFKFWSGEGNITIFCFALIWSKCTHKICDITCEFNCLPTIFKCI